VARDTVTPIEPLRVDAVQALHARGKGRLGGVDSQVIVVGHLAVGEDAPLEAPHNIVQ
jgi:hypothetical protein